MKISVFYVKLRTERQTNGLTPGKT